MFNPLSIPTLFGITTEEVINPALKPFSPETGTSTMYDVLAASYPSVFTMVDQELSLVVTNEGFTLINATFGKRVNVSVKFLTPDSYNYIKRIDRFDGVRFNYQE